VQEGEALVQVHTAGICNTDLEITRGYQRFAGILGHEFAGEVVESDDPSWLGRRVCGEINISCGACDLCVAGLRTHCRRRTVLGILRRNGVFADFLALPVRNLHAIPDSVPDSEAVFVEPLAAAFEILEQVDILSSMRVLILGDGKLGLLCAQVIASTGADLLVLGQHPEKWSVLKSAGIPAALSDEATPKSADVVIEATGSSSGLEAALQSVQPRGTIVLKSTVAVPSSLDLAPLVVNEVTVVGSRCGPFERAIEALASRQVDVQSLISERYPLEDGVRAIERAAAPGVLKVLLDVCHPSSDMS
jgi:threonine dehydrogenase-like Zn-dependent dehydrogenase